MSIRKRSQPQTTKRPKVNLLDNIHDDESVSSDDDNDMAEVSEEEEETVDAKRVRLAREYLSRIDQQEGSSSSESEDDEEDISSGDRMSRKLASARLKASGSYERNAADKLGREVAILTSMVHHGTTVTESPEEAAKAWRATSLPSNADSASTSADATTTGSKLVTYLSGHDQTPTSLAAPAHHLSVAYSGGKDHRVVRYDLERETSTVLLNRNLRDPSNNGGSSEVLAMVVTDDDRTLVTGGRDGLVRIYDVRLMGNDKSTSGLAGGDKPGGLVTTFRGHKGPVTSLALRSQSMDLFSGSEDRCIRHYNLNEMAYLETLYGHEHPITSLSVCSTASSNNIRPISTSRDRTHRLWKLREESHLIFRGKSSDPSSDTIRYIKDHWFVSGNERGDLSLWNVEKKKPVDIISGAHGSGDGTGNGNMIVSCDCLIGSDLVATGSHDGYLKFWKARTGKSLSERGIDPVLLPSSTSSPLLSTISTTQENQQEQAQIPIHGFLNEIKIVQKAQFALVAVGQEHRLGRWLRIPRAKNRLAIVKLMSCNADFDDDENGKDDDENMKKENNKVEDGDSDSSNDSSES